LSVPVQVTDWKDLVCKMTYNVLMGTSNPTHWRTFPPEGIQVQAGRDCQVVPGKHGPFRFQMIVECHRALTGMPPGLDWPLCRGTGAPLRRTQAPPDPFRFFW